VLEADAGLLEHGDGVGGVVVAAFGDYAFDAAVDDEHGAGAAGGHAAVEGCAFDGDAAAGSLAEGVLFGVDGADAVLGDGVVFVQHALELVADFVAVGEAHRGADVAGDEDLVVAGDDAARAAPVARRAFCDGSAYFHKIVVPTGADIGFLAFVFHISGLLALKHLNYTM